MSNPTQDEDQAYSLAAHFNASALIGNACSARVLRATLYYQMLARLPVRIVCPTCKADLSIDKSGASCSRCSRNYPFRGEVLSFLEPGSSFNPTRFQAKQEQEWSSTAKIRDKIRQSRMLSFVNKMRIRFSMSGRRDRVFLKEMHGKDKGQLILDLGCGGGRHYFTEYGQVVGIDPVMDLLHISKGLYSEVYHASATALPFPDSSFDYVVSSDVIGHIPAEVKDQVFSEMFRVLRPGGRTVHVIETDATNCWYRFAHKYPDLFEEYFVQHPGHISLELPTQLRSRFLRHGFNEVRFKKYAGAVQDCGALAGAFDNEYKNKSTLIRTLVSIDRLCSKSLLTQEALNVVLEPLAQIADHFTPLDSANGALVVYEKPKTV